ncbi:LysR family transcriptional regulator [Zooshikella marina]|uniref:LysR family transcriptional regulator n=1 Tax=Zooshikella ganghwensis TaxID=202772 RepID=UPI001BAF58DD|nr:LysR family transcriptional regulator [Zooshikella ganghwensis]MBU2704498.1 LysR family transcriptional regulator [Zooshikella ganghwensis]
MRLNIKHLLAIEELVKTGNFRVASQNLCISQPALSKQIKYFEELYDIEIFIRGAKGIELSDAGKAIIPEIISLNRHAEKVEKYIVNTSKNISNLHIGFGKSSYDFLPGLIRDFKTSYPSLCISLIDLPSYEQEEQLLTGVIDIGFMREPKTNVLNSIKVSSDEFVLVVSKHIHKSDSIEYYLQHYDLLMLSLFEKSEMNNQILKIISGLDYRINSISKDIQTIVALVTSNVGVAILPEKSIYKDCRDIAVIPLGEETRWDIHMVWDPNRMSKSVNLFVEYVKGNFNI